MDVREAAQKIRHAIPGARFSWTDYDMSLSVAHPSDAKAFIVYQAPRDDIGQPEIIGDVDGIIELLDSSLDF